ncbi:hypothetical protein NXC12_CH01096 [Rhizobium etli]|uniref:Uncharacterized protein n=1 Tax=Rhizobium etli TaxID=29449 RepID=A0AAN1BDE8_RHIET|nr:hypothetical protein NXC12_CH01096 [Rhizobium etli]
MLRHASSEPMADNEQPSCGGAQGSLAHGRKLYSAAGHDRNSRNPAEATGLLSAQSGRASITRGRGQ